MASDPSTLLARRGQEHKQIALQNALQVLASGTHVDRPDTPDEVVTAVRRLPPVEAVYAPYPGGLDPRLQAGPRGARRHGSSTSHQAEAIRARRRRPQRRRHDAHGVGQDALLQPAGAATHPEGSVDARAVPVPDQGARAGPDGGAARARWARLATCRRRADRRPHLRRRHAGRTRAARSARARTSCSAIPTCCTRASCRTIPGGRSSSRTSSSSSSTSCTRIAACSAATCPTCCAGCSASAGTTDRIRSSSARRRPSPIPRELAERLAERPFELVDKSGAPRGEKFFVFVNPPVVNRELGIRRLVPGRGAARGG